MAALGISSCPNPATLLSHPYPATSPTPSTTVHHRRRRRSLLALHPSEQVKQLNRLGKPSSNLRGSRTFQPSQRAVNYHGWLASRWHKEQDKMVQPAGIISLYSIAYRVQLIIRYHFVRVHLDVVCTMLVHWQRHSDNLIALLRSSCATPATVLALLGHLPSISKPLDLGYPSIPAILSRSCTSPCCSDPPLMTLLASLLR